MLELLYITILVSLNLQISKSFYRNAEENPVIIACEQNPACYVCMYMRSKKRGM